MLPCPVRAKQYIRTMLTDLIRYKGGHHDKYIHIYENMNIPQQQPKQKHQQKTST